MDPWMGTGAAMVDSYRLSREQLRHWEADPTKVATEEHSRFCLDGYCYVEQDGNDAALTCPVCRNEKALAKAQAAIERSGIGVRYWGLEWRDLEQLDPLPRIETACGRIGEVVSAGHNLVLIGAPGCGKTQSAVMIIKAAIRAGYTAHLENLGRVSADIREGYSSRDAISEAGVIRQLSETDVLVLDDLGAGETANAEVERRVLYLVMEARQNAAKPTIVTTNLTLTELSKAVGVRIMNRLQPMASITFAHGKNFRLASQQGVLW